MTDTPDDEPITPEVVNGGGRARQGASSRKRRVSPSTSAPVPDEPPATRPAGGLLGRGEPTGRIFRMAAMLLVLVGLLELVLTVPAILDPAKARCTAAQNAITFANDDDDDFNDTSLPEGVDDAKDLDCTEALALAGQIPENEDDQPAPDAEFRITENAILVPSIIFAIHGIVAGVVGFLLRRKPSRNLRNVAVLLVIVAIVPLAQLQIIGLGLVVFLIFGFAFSADAKAMFPRSLDKPSLFRPRPPAAS